MGSTLKLQRVDLDSTKWLVLDCQPVLRTAHMPKPPHNLHHWLCDVLGTEHVDVNAMQGDASSRQYFRITQAQDTYIAMVDTGEHSAIHAFITITDHLKNLDLPVPKRIAVDTNLGFLLQEDLGDQTLLNALNTENTLKWYEIALQHLKILQDSNPEPLNPRATEDWANESMLFSTWYCDKHCKNPLNDHERSIVENILEVVTKGILAQPQVPTHRDYHSRNLMVHQNTLFIIDYQDAFLGPACYDIISLLNDYYAKLSQEHFEKLQQMAWQLLLPNTSFETYTRWLDLTGLQRHLKNLGNFARLVHRDGKTRYLGDIPTIIIYLQNICNRQPDLRPLLPILEKRLPFSRNNP